MADQRPSPWRAARALGSRPRFIVVRDDPVLRFGLDALSGPGSAVRFFETADEAWREAERLNGERADG